MKSIGKLLKQMRENAQSIATAEIFTINVLKTYLGLMTPYQKLREKMTLHK